MPARPFHDASEPTTRCLKNNCSGVAEVKLFQQHEETPKGCVMRWTSIVKAFRTEHHAHNRTMTEQGGRNKATYYPPFLTYLQLVCALLGNKTPKNTKKYLSQNKSNSYSDPAFTHSLTEIETKTKPALWGGEAACLVKCLLCWGLRITKKNEHVQLKLADTFIIFNQNA